MFIFYGGCQEIKMRSTKCEGCGYRAITHTDKCLHCGSKLEVLASEIEEPKKRKEKLNE